MEPQTALAEKDDDHIEDESYPAGQVKDGGFYMDNENLLAGKTKCKGEKRKSVLKTIQNQRNARKLVL